MIKDELLKIEAVLNGQPCKYCNKQHHVSFKVSGTELRSTVTHSFSEDTCQDFKDEALIFVTSILNRMGYPVTSL